MDVFITWSGDTSRVAASALRDWLPNVIQTIRPWMSQADINAGARWSHVVSGQLSQTRVGILCLTKSNQTAPWIMFEAGALAKIVEESFVCPYLLNFEPADIAKGPLTQFQAKRANEK